MVHLNAISIELVNIRLANDFSFFKKPLQGEMSPEISQHITNRLEIKEINGWINDMHNVNVIKGANFSGHAILKYEINHYIKFDSLNSKRITLKRKSSNQIP